MPAVHILELIIAVGFWQRAGGFKLYRDSAPFYTGKQTDTDNVFTPPALSRSVQTTGTRSIILQFYGVPTTPGNCCLFAGFIANMAVPAPVKALLPLAEWWFHLGQNVVLDSDAMILHVQVNDNRATTEDTNDLAMCATHRWCATHFLLTPLCMLSSAHQGQGYKVPVCQLSTSQYPAAAAAAAACRDCTDNVMSGLYSSTLSAGLEMTRGLFFGSNNNPIVITALQAVGLSTSFKWHGCGWCILC